jgi:3-dehydroquinate dehydratase
MSGQRKTSPYTEETLREATRDAHEAIQGLKETAREMKAVIAEAKAERERLAQEREGLVDLIKAVWDQKMDDVVEAALEHYNVTIMQAIAEGTDAVYERFEKIADLLLNPGNYTLEQMKALRDEPKSAVEFLVADKIMNLKGGER